MPLKDQLRGFTNWCRVAQIKKAELQKAKYYFDSAFVGEKVNFCQGFIYTAPVVLQHAELEGIQNLTGLLSLHMSHDWTNSVSPNCQLNLTERRSPDVKTCHPNIRFCNKIWLKRQNSKCISVMVHQCTSYSALASLKRPQRTAW